MLFRKYQMVLIEGKASLKDKNQTKYEFYNNYFKKWLKGNDTKMYSTHNEGRSVKRFIRTLKTKIYKYTTSVSQNVYN